MGECLSAVGTVVQPADSDTPGAIDRVIASGIETVEVAQEIAMRRSQRFHKVLDKALDALSAYEELNDGDSNWVTEIMVDLERARDFKVGPITADEL